MRLKNVLLVVAALLVINLPAAHGALQRQRLSTDGVDVRARMLQQRIVGGDGFLAFAVPADSPERGDQAFRATVQVARTTYDRAGAVGIVEVRVLPGSTTVWSVPGQVTSRAGLVITLVLDLILLVMVLLGARFGHRLRPQLVLVAEEDLEPGSTQVALERLDGTQRYLVSGVVASVEVDALVLDVGGRVVRVLLRGHANPAGVAQPVSVVGTMIA